MTSMAIGGQRSNQQSHRGNAYRARAQRVLVVSDGRAVEGGAAVHDGCGICIR
jgi:hypothetical protein